MQERKRLDVTVVYLHQAFISFVVLYKRGFVMFGVVSLTMGNSVLPFGHRLIGYMEHIRQLRLRQPLIKSGFPDKFSEFDVVHIIPPFFPWAPPEKFLSGLFTGASWRITA